MTDIVERLLSKRYVREQWHEPIGTQVVSCDEDDEGAEAILRNPDGPEAATTIETLRRELDEARGGLSEAVDLIENPSLADEKLCCTGFECGCQGATVGQLFLHHARKTLGTSLAESEVSDG